MSANGSRCNGRWRCGVAEPRSRSRARGRRRGRARRVAARRRRGRRSGRADHLGDRRAPLGAPGPAGRGDPTIRCSRRPGRRGSTGRVLQRRSSCCSRCPGRARPRCGGVRAWIPPRSAWRSPTRSAPGRPTSRRWTSRAWRGSWTAPGAPRPGPGLRRGGEPGSGPEELTGEQVVALLDVQEDGAEARWSSVVQALLRRPVRLDGGDLAETDGLAGVRRASEEPAAPRSPRSPRRPSGAPCSFRCNPSWIARSPGLRRPGARAGDRRERRGHSGARGGRRDPAAALGIPRRPVPERGAVRLRAHPRRRQQRRRDRRRPPGPPALGVGRCRPSQVPSVSATSRSSWGRTSPGDGQDQERPAGRDPAEPRHGRRRRPRRLVEASAGHRRPGRQPLDRDHGSLRDLHRYLDATDPVGGGRDRTRPPRTASDPRDARARETPGGGSSTTSTSSCTSSGPRSAPSTTSSGSGATRHASTGRSRTRSPRRADLRTASAPSARRSRRPRWLRRSARTRPAGRAASVP